jgi:hypothetical protein
MIGRTETDSAGNITFIPWSCEFCQLDSAGKHDWDCPNQKVEVFISGPSRLSNSEVSHE